MNRTDTSKRSNTGSAGASLDKERFDRWRNTVGCEWRDVVDLSRPSLRSLVALALIENKGQPLTYEDLSRIIREKDLFGSHVSETVIDKFLYKEGLRVALSSLARQFKMVGGGLRIASTKIGREARFSLQGTHAPVAGTTVQTGAWSFHRFESGLTIPLEIARTLLRDGGGLAFASAYAPYRSAAKWLSFSSGYSSKKIQYEANAFFAYDLDKICLSGTETLTVFGLATGEGLGEVELLEQLLAETKKRQIRIEYLAIDTSEFLLASHAQLIRQRFAADIAAGSLNPRFAVGNLYELKSIVEKVQQETASDFASKGPVLCTFFGNCLGNYEYHEWDFFRATLETVTKDRALVTLVGVSLLRRSPSGKPIQEKYTLDPFWLETPRHLLYELKVMRSEGSDEFQIDEGEALPYIPYAHYETAQGIRGVVYRFYYTLKHLLETSDGQEKMDGGQSIHLYSIIKYDLQSLLDSIAKRNLIIKNPTKSYETLVIRSGKEEFHYSVFATIRKAAKS